MLVYPIQSSLSCYSRTEGLSALAGIAEKKKGAKKNGASGHASRSERGEGTWNRRETNKNERREDKRNKGPYRDAGLLERLLALAGEGVHLAPLHAVHQDAEEVDLLARQLALGHERSGNHVLWCVDDKWGGGKIIWTEYAA